MPFFNRKKPTIVVKHFRAFSGLHLAHAAGSFSTFGAMIAAKPLCDGFLFGEHLSSHTYRTRNDKKRVAVTGPLISIRTHHGRRACVCVENVDRSSKEKNSPRAQRARVRFRHIARPLCSFTKSGLACLLDSRHVVVVALAVAVLFVIAIALIL